jgi:hypothetical protein
MAMLRIIAGTINLHENGTFPIAIWINTIVALPRAQAVDRLRVDTSVENGL